MEKNEIKILCIDDLQDNLISLKALTREAFPNAVTLMAENGPDGIQLALSEDPDVILLDVVMPGMDGFEVCRKLKADPKACDIPVVFITALKGDKQSRIRALEVGAEAFLAKPIDETELTAQIRAMVKIKAANNQNRQEKENLAQLVAEKTRELNQAHTTTLLLVEDIRNENEIRKQNEMDLRESEAALKKAQQVSHVGSWLWHVQQNRLEWSDEMYHIFGIKKENFNGNLADVITSAIHPDDRAAVNESNRSVAEVGKPIPLEYRVIRPDGTGRVVWAEAGELILNVEGKSDVLTGIVQDITERKQAEEALRENQMMLTNILDSVPQNIFWKDLAGVYLGCNENFAQTVGLTSPDQIIGKTDYDLPWSRAAADTYRADDQEVISQNLPKRHIIEPGQTADGTPIWADTTKVPLLNAAGKPYGVLGVYEDITERKQTEEAQRQSEARFRTLFEQAAVGVMLTETKTGRYVAVNQRWCDFIGFSKEELLNRNFQTFTYPDDLQVNVDNNDLMVAGKIREYSMEKRYIRKDGITVWATLTVSPMWKLDEKPDVYLHIAIVQDITERKRIEKQLGESESHYRSLVEGMPGIVYSFSSQRGGLYYSPLVANILGYSPEQLLAQPMLWHHSIHPDDLPRVDQSIHETVLDQGFEIEYRILDAQGKWHWLADRSISHKIEGDEVIIEGLVLDITDRKQIEDALNKSNYLLSRLAEQVPGCVFQFRLFPDGRYSFPYTSPGIEEAFEMTPEEVHNDATPMIGRLHPEDHDQFIAAAQKSARSLQIFHIEFRVILPRQGLRWQICHAQPERMEDGGTLWYGIFSDITERKLAEQKINEQLDELRRWYSAMLGREKRTIELKKEVNDLLLQAGQPPRYAGSQEVAHE